MTCLRSLTAAERQLLRDLARRVAEIAHLPIQQERIALWADHNSLRPTRPMMLLFPEGGWREILPDSQLACTDPRTRCRLEMTLKDTHTCPNQPERFDRW